MCAANKFHGAGPCAPVPRRMLTAHTHTSVPLSLLESKYIGLIPLVHIPNHLFVLQEPISFDKHSNILHSGWENPVVSKTLCSLARNVGRAVVLARSSYYSYVCQETCAIHLFFETHLLLFSETVSIARAVFEYIPNVPRRLGSFTQL